MKSKTRIFLLTAVVFIIYNVVLFILPISRDVNFWIAYIFTVISLVFGCGVLISKFSIKNINRTVKNATMIWLAVEYLLIQFVIGFVEIFKTIDYRTSLIINVILLGFNIIALSVISTENKEIEKIDTKVNEKTFFLKLLKENIQEIKDKTDNEKLSKQLLNLEETIKYSDPMTHSKLLEIENSIEIKVEELKESVSKSEYEKASTQIDTINTMLIERNRKAKLYKGTLDNLQEKEKESSNRAIIISAVSFITLLIIGITSYYTVIVPYTKYSKAEEMLKNKDYINAQDAFKELGNYKDSSSKANESMYRYATELLEKNEFEKAIKVFDELSNYNDSASQKNNAIYKYANYLFDNGEYIKASEKYNTIADYKDSKEKSSESIYVYASSLLKIEKFEEAEEEYKKIPNYKDSNDMVNESIYLHAKKLLDNKEYSKSAEQFLRIGNYKDSKSKVLEIYNYFGEKDVIYFGKYNDKPIGWQVLDTKDKKVLLIATDIIEDMSFNSEYKAINWDNSVIRNWLNNEFYNGFDDNERANILINASGKDTIFLLTANEINYYTQIRNCSKAWWINTVGKENTMFMYVDEAGNINREGDIVTKLHGVRPAIWLNLE